MSTTYGQVPIHQGITVSGRLQLLDWSISIQARIKKGLFMIDAKMDPIRFPNKNPVIEIGKSLQAMNQGPKFYVHISKRAQDIDIKGALKINFLNIEAAVSIVLKKVAQKHPSIHFLTEWSIARIPRMEPSFLTEA